MYRKWVDILLDAVLCDVATDGGAIRDIAVMCQGGIRRISGKVFIDCTGDGILSVLAGAEYEAGRLKVRSISRCLYVICWAVWIKRNWDSSLTA